MLAPVAALLLAVVGLVLLIACANLASFLLARAEDRRKEIAVRLALGASRATLVRQLLLETTLLALMGGAAGLVPANWTLGILMSFQPPLPIPVDLDISLDRTVLFFTLGISSVAGVVFGLVPALQASTPDVAPTLKDESPGTGKPGRFNLRNALVIAQVSFSFVLLIGTGLFVRSLQKAQAIDPILPGVPSETPDGDHDIDNTLVTASYFETMAVPILAGRSFLPSDVEEEPVVVVSEALVRRFYPGEDLIGRSVETTGGNQLRIVGVAADTKVRSLGEAPRPYIYELQGQRRSGGMQVLMRGRAPARSCSQLVREFCGT